MPTQEQIEREKRFDEKVPQMITDLIWTVTDGGQKIEPKRFLSYQEEPVREFDDLKSFLNSEVEQAVVKEKLRLLEILSKWALKTKTTEALDMIEEAQKEIAH